MFVLLVVCSTRAPWVYDKGGDEECEVMGLGVVLIGDEVSCGLSSICVLE